MSSSDAVQTALRNARRQADERGLDRYLVVDADSHHFETLWWNEISEHIEDPVLRHAATSGLYGPRDATFLIGTQLAPQNMSGRIQRPMPGSSEDDGHPDAAYARAAMDMMGIDYQVMFPTPLLNIGLHPQAEVETGVARAYARWMTERVLADEPRVLTLLLLPFNDPEACVELVEQYADRRGVAGFMVTTTRHRPIHDPAYLPVFRAVEESGAPLAFHAGYAWQERPMDELDRFASVHALAFPFSVMIHVTNWVVNGMPERFPALDVIWIEAGLAWIPFLMQRLDTEILMRSSEAPLLQRKPSEYLREMYYTSQPLEVPDDLSILDATFRMIDAENRLLFASDYPHWDFDLPSRVFDLPFLSEHARRNILGRTAARLFRLPVDREMRP